jgi:protein-S-isoprenylcysteine O-methyltransferase Ste14
MPTSVYLYSIAFVLIAAAALFGSAGTFAITGFWIFLAIIAGSTLASFALLSPDLFRERLHPGGKRPPLGLRLVGSLPLAQMIVAGLDRGRLHLTDAVPVWLQAAALAAVAAAFAVFLWAMTVNPFFSSVARIQDDRGQHLITGGPYRFVRHPGYSAGILLIIFSGLALGSWLAAALVFFTGMPLIVFRATAEDRMLRAGLPGYTDYAGRVRWWVFPGLW